MNTYLLLNKNENKAPIYIMMSKSVFTSAAIFFAYKNNPLALPCFSYRKGSNGWLKCSQLLHREQSPGPGPASDGFYGRDHFQVIPPWFQW